MNKGVAVVVGLGLVAAVGGVAYAMSNKGVSLVHGEAYVWTDSVGYPTEQYEALGWQSLSRMVIEGERMQWQGVWGGADTVWVTPEGVSTPQLLGA
jgi:hypothetical protein